jgi:hypothetical protein
LSKGREKLQMRSLSITAEMLTTKNEEPLYQPSDDEVPLIFGLLNELMSNE